MPKVLKVILNILLVPILFSSLIMTIISYGISSSFSNNNIKKVVKTTINNNISEEDAEKSLLSSLYKTAQSYGIKKDSVNKILKKEKVQILISEYIYYMAIETEKELTKEHLDYLMDDAFEEIKKDAPLLPESIKEELKIDLYNQYKNQRENMKREIAKGNNVDSVTRFTGIIKFIKNKTLRVCLISSLIISIMALSIINFKKFIFMRIISITSAISSISVFALSKLLILIAKTEDNIGNIVKLILEPLIKYSLIVLGLSIIIFITYIIISSRKKGLEN